MQRILLVIGLLGACNSKPSGEKVKPTKAEKAAKAADEWDAMLVDPPANVVSAMGADVYPGAKMMKSFEAMTINRSVDYVFFTKDEPANVRAFYASKLTAAQLGDPVAEKAGVFIVKGTNSKGEAVAVQAQGQAGRTNVHFVVTKK